MWVKKGRLFMSNYLGYSVAPAIYPLVAENKGDITNRVNCAGAQFTNNLKGGLTVAAAYGAGAGAGYLALKNPGVTSKIAQGITKVLKKLPDCKFVQTLVKASPKVKVLGAIAGVTTMVVSYIAGKTIFKAGQIDQKYTDKATWENKVKNVFDV